MREGVARSLSADWSRAGETEAVRSIHPFQFHPRALLPHSSGVRVRAPIAKRRFILCCQETRISFIAGRRRISSEKSGSGPPPELQSKGFVRKIAVGFTRFTVTIARLSGSAWKKLRRREY
ncbi:hypothetical protein E1301_Tti020037 [Triplophysa tibetana]|uniref:Uncharacterized protein n=1 Tax=Triplophysa tibetana TaxID=1572043 RepID=A0A5A9NAC4_9TELE|nr:hypothetical protein E1301_Tti020037 [Triplophysa tibetana]